MISTILLGFMGLGGQEVIIVLIVVLLLFGGKKIPELAKGLGKGIHDFKKAYKEGEVTEGETKIGEGNPEPKK